MSGDWGSGLGTVSFHEGPCLRTVFSPAGWELGLYVTRSGVGETIRIVAQTESSVELFACGQPQLIG
jgi:hypothetical protein